MIIIPIIHIPIVLTFLSTVFFTLYPQSYPHFFKWIIPKLGLKCSYVGTKTVPLWDYTDYYSGYRDESTMKVMRHESLGIYIYAKPKNLRVTSTSDKIHIDLPDKDGVSIPGHLGRDVQSQF